MPGPWIRIGTVRTVNPARRELRIDAEGAQTHQFDGLEWVGLGRNADAVTRCRVESSTVRGDDATVRLSAGVTRDSVAAMRKAGVFIEGSTRKARPDGGWHPDDLLGLTVVGPGGAVLGTIAEWIETGANDVMEIEKPGGGRLLLPAIEQVIESVDLEAGRVYVGDISPYAVDDED
ncbi:MAG: 16S rRNA processing protein RimM [Candidatus Hydrogenedentes bacterium]|nr:16S rRNA processing protein RimM [Candidatus Hydrogenedentota bacterium]